MIKEKMLELICLSECILSDDDKVFTAKMQDRYNELRKEFTDQYR